MRHTISILVENEFGVLSRVAGLFAGRGYNIESLVVAETTDPQISRMTIVTRGSDEVIEQIVKQLNKLVNVLKVVDVTQESTLIRNLLLAKVHVSQKNRLEVLKTIEIMRGEVLEASPGQVIAEFCGDEKRIRTVLALLKPFGIVELAQTGNLAMTSGQPLSVEKNG